ncbi:MAG: PfkB family carbohydrate kinase, partial [Cucumibacter sp.]
IAKQNRRKVVFDLDYRPNLWGLAGHAAGDLRYVASSTVSERLKTVLADCDLIVGTEEEILVGSGQAELLSALRTIRSLSNATIVLKRGPMGCIVYEGAISRDLADGIVGKGFPIEVFNVLGAGDAFMSGFLRGWLRGEPYQTSATWANACGAIVVSRLLCAPEIPTFDELQYFLAHGSNHHALRRDERINHVHWATTRRRQWPQLMALAIDHRTQLEEMAIGSGAEPGRIAAFKLLAVRAAEQVAGGRPGFGMLLDDKHGRSALFAAEKLGFWIGRPVEAPGSRPLRFEFSQDVGSRLIEWPVEHCIKCLCFFHPRDDAALRENQTFKLRTLYEAARKIGRELMIEIIASKNGPVTDDTVALVLDELFRFGIMPDWWKLESQPSRAAWERIAATITAYDPWCRGIVILGLDAPEAELVAGFEAAAAVPMVRGFAVGRTIFADAARRWLAGEIGDATAISEMAARFGRLSEAWLRLRGRSAGKSNKEVGR